MDELLQQGTRRRIFEAVRANPGISARELQRALHLGWGQTAYHLDQLTRGGALRRERAGGRDRYFPQEMTWEDRKILLFLRSPAERVLLVEMLASPGLTFAELPSRVGLSRSTVSFHLRHMIERGVVESYLEGESRRYRPTSPARVQGLLRSYRESFDDRLVDRFLEAFVGLLRE